MSHSVIINQVSPLSEILTLTIPSYTNGTGESFTLAELGLLPKATPVVPLINPSVRNSLGVLLWPVFANGVLKLFQFVGGTPTEIATNATLNATFDVAIFAGND